MMKNMTMRVAIALTMMAMTMAGCSNHDEGDNDDNQQDHVFAPEDNAYTPMTLSTAEKQLVNKSNDFAFNLFREVTAKDADKSEIVSPISITYALGMLNNGAGGETLAQINKVLGFGDTGADGINQFCRKMLTEAPALDKLTKVMIANTIYMNKGYVLKPDFVAKAKAYYDAEPETRDFADGKTLDVINQWASDHTEHMIEKVLTEDEFDPASVSYLLNAIYFKGAWAMKFNSSNTKDETFHTKTGNVKVPMMRQESFLGYNDTEDFQMLKMPYGNGAFIMTLLLPHEGKTVADVLKDLTEETWKRLAWAPTAIVDVKMPRFESETSVNLVPVMKSLGMPDAFDGMKAEFPDFCDVPTYISLMKQVAKIKLNEEGTEAAAVTVIGSYAGAAGPIEPQKAVFHATRPFLYVISEQSTGAIFFIGQYMGN